MKHVTDDEVIIKRIFVIRGKKVLLDMDLAELYGVPTKRLNEQVQRNRLRFPADFMFQITHDEFESLKSQIATSSWGGRRKLPFAFTEHGVAMLSGVLKSETAIDVNIRIIRAFIKMRELLEGNGEILKQLEKMEKKLAGHDKEIALIFQYLKKLLNPPIEKRRRIGFRRKDENE